MHFSNSRYVCEQNHIERDDFDNREFAKLALKYHPQGRTLKCDRELKQIYKKLQPLRNSTAHSLETTKNVQNMLKVLSESVSQLEEIIK